MIKIRNRFSLQTIRTLKPLNNETIIFHSYQLYILYELFGTRNHRDAPKDQTIDDRSLSMEPTVSHDRNVIYIHSDIAIENMQITIRDKYKDIIYTNQLTILQSQNYSFSFNSPGEKEFTIELSYKDINLQGHFTID